MTTKRRWRGPRGPTRFVFGFLSLLVSCGSCRRSESECSRLERELELLAGTRPDHCESSADCTVAYNPFMGCWWIVGRPSASAIGHLLSRQLAVGCNQRVLILRSSAVGWLDCAASPTMAVECRNSSCRLPMPSDCAEGWACVDSKTAEVGALNDPSDARLALDSGDSCQPCFCVPRSLVPTRPP